MHSDWAPDNVLVSPHRAWLIDWDSPTLGAAWTDPACHALTVKPAAACDRRPAETLPGFLRPRLAFVLAPLCCLIVTTGLGRGQLPRRDDMGYGDGSRARGGPCGPRAGF